jgi:hypothetical protein
VRFAIVFLIGMAGCVATLPDDPTISADLACEVARAVVQLRAAPDATPDDKPKPGDKCPNCDGRGYVGDGTVKVKCQPCEGTGRVK